MENTEKIKELVTNELKNIKNIKSEMKATLLQTNEQNRCPHCKKIAIVLISLTDDGKGKRYCWKCKNEIRAKHPQTNYSKIDIKKEVIKNVE
jgi:hypothetical protein